MYIFKKYKYFSSFGAGNCDSNCSFKWRKIQLKQFSRTRVNYDWCKMCLYLQDARREEMLVQRLVRQSQQERRLAVQLLQVRQEKEVLRRNRLLRQEQYQERRLQELQESMDKEAVRFILIEIQCSIGENVVPTIKYWTDYTSLNENGLKYHTFFFFIRCLLTELFYNRFSLQTYL